MLPARILYICMYLGTRNQYKPPLSVLRGFLLCRFNIRQHPRDGGGGGSLAQSINSGKDLINFTRRTRQKDTPPPLPYNIILLPLLIYYTIILYTSTPTPLTVYTLLLYSRSRRRSVCIYLPSANYRVKLISFEVRVCPVVDTRGCFLFFLFFNS